MKKILNQIKKIHLLTCKNFKFLQSITRQFIQIFLNNIKKTQVRKTWAIKTAFTVIRKLKKIESKINNFEFTLNAWTLPELKTLNLLKFVHPLPSLFYNSFPEVVFELYQFRDSTLVWSSTSTVEYGSGTEWVRYGSESETISGKEVYIDYQNKVYYILILSEKVCAFIWIQCASNVCLMLIFFN